MIYIDEQAVMETSPIAKNLSQSKITEEDLSIRGINRISRHSTFMSFAFLGLGNLLTRGHLTGWFILFFASMDLMPS